MIAFFNEILNQILINNIINYLFEKNIQKNPPNAICNMN